MRWLLNCLYLCTVPYWLWKLPQARRYRAGIPERLGYAPAMDPGLRRLWVHCSSVGEASIPRTLVNLFRRSHPRWQVVFSTFTDTGADRLRELYPDSMVFYWPLDLTFCVSRALERVKPSLVLLVELEVWPNFMDACLRRGVPVAIVNGRISESSVRGLKSLSRLCGRLWEPVELCCARSPGDAKRLQRAGLPGDRVKTTGSLKYDALTMKADQERLDELRQLFGLEADASVLVAGSTHPGEEEVVCQVYLELKREHPSLRLILVPRHIERARQVASDVRSMNLPMARKTELDADATAVTGEEVILVDTIGDLVNCYGLASCVFVGRSLLPPGGGQNMMEPAALGKPVVVGPHTGNFEPEMDLLRREKGVLVVADADDLWKQCHRLLSDRDAAESLGQRARESVIRSQGAAERTLRELQGMLLRHGLPAEDKPV